MFILSRDKLPGKEKNPEHLKVFIAAVNKSFIWDTRIIFDMYELVQCHW